MEVVVEYEYDALHEDELSLRLGQVIRNVRKVEEEGWMEGDLNGRRGLFPDNFVKEVRRESKEMREEQKEDSQTQRREKEEQKEDSQPQRREKSAGNVANLVQRMSTYGIPAGGFQPHSQPRAPKKKPKKRQCRALFEYLPQNEDELELKIGDIIDINEEVEEGWWSGTMNGKSGLFPSNFVKEVETGEDGEINDVADETDGSGKEALPPATSPHSSPGNGIIAQPKKIRGIGFGDIFREGSVKLKVRLPSTDTEEKKDKPIPSLPSSAKPAHPSPPDCQRADGDSKAKVKEICKATFAFEATNDDELTLKEGDIIQILSKDTGEPGWWRGQIGGQEGVFPDNFVTLLSDAEKETPTSRGSVKLSPKLEPEERPKKPPPPSKSLAPKPEVPNADKKPQQPRPEDRGDQKPGKPAAPVVPPKKPVPPPGKGRPGSLPPKRPDKPLAPSSGTRHNGEVPSLRPKSDLEPTLTSKPKTLSGDWGERALDMDLMSFDDLSSVSEKLSHPTANRPKMPGRRLPAQFGGHSPSKEVNVEKTFRMEEEEGAKPKLTDTRKPSMSTLSHSTPVQKPSPASTEPKPSPATPPSPGPVLSSVPALSPSPALAPSPTPSSAPAPSPSIEPASRTEPEDQAGQLEELRAQMKELLLSVELLKTQQMREIAELRGELDEEKLKRVALQVELEKLKRTVQST